MPIFFGVHVIKILSYEANLYKNVFIECSSNNQHDIWFVT